MRAQSPSRSPALRFGRANAAGGFRCSERLPCHGSSFRRRQRLRAPRHGQKRVGGSSRRLERCPTHAAPRSQPQQPSEELQGRVSVPKTPLPTRRSCHLGDTAPGSLHPKTSGCLPKNEGAEIKIRPATLKGRSWPQNERRGQLLSGGDTWKGRLIRDSAGGRGGSDTARSGGRGERGAGLGK